MSSQDDITVLKLYKQFKGWGQGDKLNASSIIMLATDLIPAVQKLVSNKHQGSYKKKVILRVLELVIQDSDLSDDAKSTLNSVLQTTVPITIDVMISVAKGDLNLGKLVKPFCCCLQ